VLWTRVSTDWPLDTNQQNNNNLMLNSCKLKNGANDVSQRTSVNSNSFTRIPGCHGSRLLAMRCQAEHFRGRSFRCSFRLSSWSPGQSHLQPSSGTEPLPGKVQCDAKCFGKIIPSYCQQSFRMGRKQQILHKHPSNCPQPLMISYTTIDDMVHNHQWYGAQRLMIWSTTINEKLHNQQWNGPQPPMIWSTNINEMVHN